MPYWAQSIMEPKRQYRFLLSGLAQGTVHEYLVKKASKPQWSMEDADHTFLNHTFKYPGRVKWENISVTIVDPGGSNDASRILYNVLQKSGYPLPGAITGEKATKTGMQYGEGSGTTVSKAGAVNALGAQIYIKQLGPTSDNLTDAAVIETWTLHNPFIKSVKYGELSYDSEDMIEIELELRYDWAVIATSVAPGT